MQTNLDADVPHRGLVSRKCGSLDPSVLIINPQFDAVVIRRRQQLEAKSPTCSRQKKDQHEVSKTTISITVATSSRAQIIKKGKTHKTIKNKKKTHEPIRCAGATRHV